jgi:hypothetical protein
MMGIVKSAVLSVRNALLTAGPLVTGLVIVTWTLLTLRLLPPVNADYGMFVTVAERLRAGDRLYADVYENKDPLFHYSLALARSVTPFGGWFLQIAWVLVCCIAAYALMAGRGASPRAAVLVSFFATPVIITGSDFFPGSSHLPAVALLLVAIAALLDGRWLLAGFVLGAVVLFKLVFIVPLGLVLIAALWWGPRRTTLRSIPVAVVTLGGLLLLMVARGELNPYLQTLHDNTAYANGPQGARGLAAIVDHVQRVILVPGTLAMILVTVALVLAVVTGHPRVLGVKPGPGSDPLFWMLVSTLTGGVVVVAFTGLWPHHGEVFVVPAVLAMVIAATAFPQVFNGNSLPSVLTVAVTALLLAAVPSPSVLMTQLEYGRSLINSQYQIPASARLIMSTGDPTSYARIGDGLDDGHAFGLNDWTLACPRFGQSIWEDEAILQSTLACLPTAEVIYITPSVKPDPNDPEWTAFLAGVDGLLASGYTCVESDAGRACRFTR